MILGDTDHGSQKTKKPRIIISKFKDLFLINSITVKTKEAKPIQNKAGFPEAKIFATLFF